LRHASHHLPPEPDEIVILDKLKKKYKPPVPRAVFGLVFFTTLVVLYVLIVWLTKSGYLKRFVKHIYRIVKKYFAIIRAFIKLYLNRKSSHIELFEDYTDEIDFVKPGREEESGDRRLPAKRRGGIGGLDPKAAKIRRFYKNILKLLVVKRITIKTSDTTGEIYCKSLRIEGISPSIDELTQVYNGVRYGERIPGDMEFQKAEDSYDGVVHILKH
jgi:hypothetical protein